MCGGDGTAMAPVAYAVMRGRHGATAANEKMRIVLDGLRGEERLARRCRRERINPNALPMSPA